MYCERSAEAFAYLDKDKVLAVGDFNPDRKGMPLAIKKSRAQTARLSLQGGNAQEGQQMQNAFVQFECMLRRSEAQGYETFKHSTSVSVSDNILTMAQRFSSPGCCLR